jgi:DNA-binding transcriptional regulator YiaG
MTPESIKAARIRLGESQRQFGRRFGVDQSTIQRWETNGPPDRGPARTLLDTVLPALALEPAAPTTEAAR